mmetsp:Transcript_15618/g.23843  ORF Transcript_15618/g.23843 Transcript_15618/m.23843 type:complete len:276 (-) Transcript_15618:1414-2241(-)
MSSVANKNGSDTADNDQPSFEKGELIAQGAEAKLYKTKYEEKTTIVKYRFPKKYRHPLLDAKLRKNRSKKEQKCIGKAREAGIRVPQLYRYDKQHCAIHMEFIDLPTVKLVIKNCYDDDKKTYDDSKCVPILKQIGKNIALLHANNLVHGDLTTSNLLIRTTDGCGHASSPEKRTDEHKQDNENENENEDEDIDLQCPQIVMIDFGLSEGSNKVEDKAVDIYVLERAFVSTHPESEYMIDVILDEYRKVYVNGHQAVLKRLDAVRLRGRKRSMIG